jgi:hypothetical protein
MSSYVSLEALKEAVGLTGTAAADTSDDGALQTVIFRAQARVDSYLALHRPGYVGIAAASNSRTAVGSNTRVYDGTGVDTLFIDDFTSVSSVAVDGATVDATAYSVWPYNETPKRALIYNKAYSPYPWLRNAHWTIGTANVAVTGYAGLNHVPADVEQTTLAVAIIYWHRYQRGEPEPAVTPRGSRGYDVDDPEVEGILVSGLQGWLLPGVWGA